MPSEAAYAMASTVRGCRESSRVSKGSSGPVLYTHIYHHVYMHVSINNVRSNSIKELYYNVI